jgi:hypothetical protein
MNSVIIYNDDELHIARNAAYRAVEVAREKHKQTELEYSKALKRKHDCVVFSGISKASQEYWEALVELETASLIHSQYSGANHGH